MGKRRLEKALKTAEPALNIKAEVEWLPYFLDPTLPTGKGKNKLEHYNKKFGPSRVAAMVPRMQATGKEEGIEFSYGGNVGNTMDSHRLIALAKTQGKTDAVVEALMSSYFEKEKALSDTEVLVAAAKTAGVEGAEAMLDSDKFKDEVLSEVRMARNDYGVSGVPFFIFDDKFAFSGAQPAETIVRVLKQVVDGSDKK